MFGLDPLKFVGVLFPALKPLLAFVLPVAAVALAVYATLLTRLVARHLPKRFQAWLANPELRAIIQFCAKEVQLDNAGRRAKAAAGVAAWFAARGLPVPESEVNLLVELLVRELKTAGVL